MGRPAIHHNIKEEHLNNMEGYSLNIYMEMTLIF